MLAVQPDAISMVRVTSLPPGELFIVSGGGGDFVAVAVENEEQRYMSWLRLTGENRFLLDRLEGGSYRAHATNVLRLGLRWSDLQLRMDETRIKRIDVVPVVGCLLVAELPSIVAKFWASVHRLKLELPTERPSRSHWPPPPSSSHLNSVSVKPAAAH